MERLPDGNYSGRFANEPNNLPGNIGDQAEFEQADISDWMFMRNEKIVGGETIKLLLKSMPKEKPTPCARGWSSRRHRTGLPLARPG